MFKTKKMLAVSFLLLLVSSVSWASELEGLKQLFRENFYNDDIYTENECAENVMRFAQLAKRKGLALVGSEILKIENYGIDNFGLVGALAARNGGNIVRDENGNVVIPNRWMAGSRNWHFHAVFAYYGQIFDFDFTNSPTVLKEPHYWREMYLTDIEGHKPQRAMSRIGNYQITSYNIDGTPTGAKKKLFERVPELFK